MVLGAVSVDYAALAVLSPHIYIYMYIVTCIYMYVARPHACTCNACSTVSL